MALSAYRSSVEMAKERGAFEVLMQKKNNPFILRLKEADENLYQEYGEIWQKKYRFINHCANWKYQFDVSTTSGIEPVFCLFTSVGER